MKLLTNTNLLKLSLVFNLILVMGLVLIYSELNNLRTENRVVKFRSELIEFELLNAKRIAQDQMEMANRHLIRARVLSQKAYANQLYANYQAQQASKYVSLVELYEQKYPSDDLKGVR